MSELRNYVETPESKNIKGVAYWGNTKVLYVEFRYGGKYVYKDVPEEVYNNMMDSDSIGSFLSKEIKGKYSYAKGK